jgi:hypothetical protein
MEKRREIPGQKLDADKPNAAPRADTDRVLQLLDQLGITTEKAFVDKFQISSRASYYRLKKFELSLGGVREIEEWLVREAQRRRLDIAPSRTEQSELLAEWARLGEQLLAADAAQFRSTLDGLRDMVESARLQQLAISKMFRATPDPTRK